MAILLEELIDQLPRDTEEKVNDAKNRIRQRIREILSEEARLYLQRKSRGRRGRTSPVNVQISVKPGLPDALAPRDKQEIEERHRLALILAPFRQTLTAFSETGKHSTEHLLPLLRREPLAKQLLNGAEQNIEPAWKYASSLLDQLKQFELTRFIFRVDADVLGTYRDRNTRLFDEPDPSIELYWGVIGLVARDLSVEVEDLTYVVLAHELGHAFTHAAVDADGECWASEQFWKSAHELKEGLAQYYTELVCQRIEDAAPGALKAYIALLPHQPAAYRTQENWKDYTLEHVRSAMLEIRRSGSAVSLSVFQDCLKKEKKRLSQIDERGAKGPNV